MKLALQGLVPRWMPLLVGGLVVIGIAFDLLTRSELSATTALMCEGEYADSLQVESARTREIEQGPRSQFSYLVRSTAKYECPFFGPDGKLRRRRVQSSELGTAFAYEASGTDTYLLTNEHVAAWPDVTDTFHRIDGVPEGCKRVEDKLRIVRDERDDFEPGQIALTRVAVDPLLDAAILKASQKLTVIPYKVGKSAGLRQGNAVEVRGFPLGVMQAVSSGKIVNPYDRDQEQGWDHVDFVIDALLAEGNSGSPVLAASCRSRDLELVGIYHAGYKGHGALNVVVGIDQLTEFMHKKKRIPRALTEGGPGAPGAADRARVKETLTAGTLPFFDFGGLFVRAEIGDGGSLLYHLYGRQFPLDDRRVAVVEDLPKEGAFGELGRLWVFGQSGWRAWPLSALGADEHDLLARVTDSVRLQVLHSVDYRLALSNASSADERRRGRDLSRAIAHDVPVARDLAGNLLDTVDRLSSARDPGAPPPAGPVATASDTPPAPSALPGIGPPPSAAPAPASPAQKRLGP
jgi:S1-C subfamily serine protease